ncbi:cytochrome c4 [Methylococcus sp. EFPC2]|nr:cytochrome c4 [Methylococcus sp. EFPC2]
MPVSGAEAPPESAEGIKQRIGQGDPAAGKTKAESELCQGCHGDDGNSTVIGVPKLAGQYAGYLIKQLQDFRSLSRRNRIMNAMAEGLGDADLADIGAYFASQTRSKNAESAPNQVAKDLFLYGDVNRSLDSCVSCHDLNGKGRISAGVTYPAIAAQTKGYLRLQLLNFKIGVRTNSPQGVMNKVADALTEEEIVALAEYLSGL